MIQWLPKKSDDSDWPGVEAPKYHCMPTCDESKYVFTSLSTPNWLGPSSTKGQETSMEVPRGASARECSLHKLKGISRKTYPPHIQPMVFAVQCTLANWPSHRAPGQAQEMGGTLQSHPGAHAQATQLNRTKQSYIKQASGFTHS